MRRTESLNVELPEMERRWLLEEEERRKRAPRRIILLFVIVILVSGLITTLVKRAVPSRSHQEEPPRFNYTLALHKSLTFFNAQQSGKLPRTADYNTSWRGDSCLEDGNYTGRKYRDLVGGYYDGVDAVKSSFSMSYSMTLLSWSVIEYGAKYETAGELRHVKEIVKWGTDYFLKTFFINANTTTQMVLKVHSPNDDYCWMRPEDIDYKRHISLCFDECAQVAAEMTASLAAASIVFKEEMEYSQKLVYGAKALYSFALSVADTQTSKLDELLWGGTWLYFATGDLTYLDHTTSHVFADRAPSSYVFSWENKLLGTQLLLTRLRLFLDPGYPYEDGLRQCHIQTSRAMCSYLPDFKTFNRTKGGLIQFGDPKPLQYAANAAFLATLYSQCLEEAGIPGWECGTTFYPNQFLRDFSKSQIDYILGENPQNMSYVVGFGERYPTHVHHRGASIPPNQKQHSCTGGWKWRDSEEGNPNTIEGAMVAGPDKHDGFQDVRVKSNYTEPSLAGNAGLVAALVAVSGGEPVDKNTMFYALPPLYPVSPPPPAPWTPYGLHSL